MKTRVYVATVIASLFAGALANAQVLGGAGRLGGGLGGGLEGATAGGLRHPSGGFHGAAAGELGGAFDVSGAHRATSDIAARAAERGQRTKGTVQSIGERAGARASRISERARGAVGAANATASSSAAAAGEAGNSSVTGDVAGSLQGGISSVRRADAAAPSVPAPAGNAMQSSVPSHGLDVSASKQQDLAIGNASDAGSREARFAGQGAGSLSGGAGDDGVSARMQGGGSATVSSQRAASQPAQ